MNFQISLSESHLLCDCPLWSYGQSWVRGIYMKTVSLWKISGRGQTVGCSAVPEKPSMIQKWTTLGAPPSLSLSLLQQLIKNTFLSSIHHSGHLFSSSKEGEKYSAPFCYSVKLQVTFGMSYPGYFPFRFSFLPSPIVFLAKSLQSCPTLCDPMDCSPPGSSVHGILQARTLEWVAMPSSRGSSPSRDGTRVSCSFCIAGRFCQPLRKPLK